MLLVLLNHIIDSYKIDNEKLLINFRNTIYYILIIGGSIITIIFIIIGLYSFRNIFLDFNIIKRAVHLIPYRRLSEDETTRFLLK